MNGERNFTDKQYLGDGVYVEDQGHHLALTTEDGMRATNTIYLEPTVYRALVDYVNRRAVVGENGAGK